MYRFQHVATLPYVTERGDTRWEVSYLHGYGGLYPATISADTYEGACEWISAREEQARPSCGGGVDMTGVWGWGG